MTYGRGSDIYQNYSSIVGYPEHACKIETSSSNNSCSTPTKDFWFDPVQAWHLNNTVFADGLLRALDDVLQTYHSMSRVMVRIYLIAISVIAASTILGFCAIFSSVGRYGRSNGLIPIEPIQSTKYLQVVNNAAFLMLPCGQAPPTSVTNVSAGGAKG